MFYKIDGIAAMKGNHYSPSETIILVCPESNNGTFNVIVKPA
jgi:hypothetical protein